MNKSNYHDPVLLQPSVAALITDPDGVYVDATFGGGGHSQEILNQLSPEGRLYAFDQDQDALENALSDDRFTLIEANFRDLKRYLKLYGVKEVTGILADFGVSSHQFDAEGRGFSIRFDGDLDMRMNQKSKVSAKEIIINNFEKIEPTLIFSNIAFVISSCRAFWTAGCSINGVVVSIKVSVSMTVAFTQLVTLNSIKVTMLRVTKKATPRRDRFL